MSEIHGQLVKQTDWKTPVVDFISPTLAQLKAQIKKSGVKVFVNAQINDHDCIQVEVTKTSALAGLAGWTDDSLQEGNRTLILSNGDVFI